MSKRPIQRATIKRRTLARSRKLKPVGQPVSATKPNLVARQQRVGTLKGRQRRVAVPKGRAAAAAAFARRRRDEGGPKNQGLRQQYMRRARLRRRRNTPAPTGN